MTSHNDLPFYIKENVVERHKTHKQKVSVFMNFIEIEGKIPNFYDKII